MMMIMRGMHVNDIANDQPAYTESVSTSTKYLPPCLFPAEIVIPSITEKYKIIRNTSY